MSGVSLYVTNSRVYGAVARRSAHELSHDKVADEWCIAQTSVLFVGISQDSNTWLQLWNPEEEGHRNVFFPPFL